MIGWRRAGPGLALVVTLSSAGGAAAAPAGLEHERIVHRVSALGGLDAAPVVGVGYDLRIVDVRPGHDLDVFVDHRIPLPGFDLADFRTDLGGEVDVLRRGLLRWTLRSSVGLVRQRRAAYVAHAVQVGGGTRLGVYWRIPGVRLDVDWDPNVATHLAQSAATRRFNPEAQDGWYSSLGMAYRLGAAVVASVNRFDIELHGGFRSTTRTSLFAARGWLVSYIPFYVGLRASCRF
ncbi:hypothetical protein [Paraliomyxa miuraensis]|uniref:hypothetical protein n=1 Tax=Paraliomyxa miuraensis TaxID=376150 RepID=UPI0022588762|nr:hypothetical protein [Paraliomyxa miuraensis]MCX4243072.1 hypothetical protein [Paraliomyxa miuraensis]